MSEMSVHTLFQRRAVYSREFVLNAVEDDQRFDRETWQYHFCRFIAVQINWNTCKKKKNDLLESHLSIR